MIFVSLPLYNEGENIGILIDKIHRGLAKGKDAYTIVAYNDGSTDNSLEILEQKKREGIPLVILGMKENRGLGYGLLTLLKYAVENSYVPEEDLVVVLDSDNSHNPEHIATHMLNKIRDGFDLVIASRYLTDSRVIGVSSFRQMLSVGASIMMRLIFPIQGVKDYTCGFRAYRVEMLKRAFSVFGDNLVTERSFACMAELLIKLGKLQVLAVEIPLLLRYDKKRGTSKMNVFRTIRRTMAMIIRLKTLSIDNHKS